MRFIALHHRQLTYRYLITTCAFHLFIVHETSHGPLQGRSHVKNTNRFFGIPHSWNKLHPPLRVLFESGASSSHSSFSSTCFDNGPVVDICHAVFLSRLKTFSQKLSLHSHLFLAQACLTTRCSAVTYGCSIDDCGRLSWLLGAL